VAININYTPYPAVGELAAAGGRAQQATRDQSYAFQAEQQANSLAESRRQSQASIKLSREQYQQNSAFQQQQFNFNKSQAAQQGIMQGAQIAAQEAASNRQFNLAQENLDFNQQMQEKANELATSLAARQERQLQSSIEAKQSTTFLDTDKANKKTQAIAAGLGSWMENKDAIVAEQGTAAYIAGLAALNNGTVPFFNKASSGDLSREQRQVNLEDKLAREATARAMKIAAKDRAISAVGGIADILITRGRWFGGDTAEEKALTDAYTLSYGMMAPENNEQVKQFNAEFKAKAKGKGWSIKETDEFIQQATYQAGLAPVQSATATGATTAQPGQAVIGTPATPGKVLTKEEVTKNAQFGMWGAYGTSSSDLNEI